MMEKLTQAGEVGGASPPPFTIFTIMFKVAVYAPAERADTLPSPGFPLLDGLVLREWKGREETARMSLPSQLERTPQLGS
jgi:hypothetical protein